MAEKTLYIRTDMNKDIATGHMMRCLSIADAAAEIGVKTVFIAADSGPVALANQRGYDCIVLSTDYRDMEGELDFLLRVLADRQATHLLVDSYTVTTEYLRRLREKVPHLIYLDDCGEHELPADAVINYLNYADEMPYDRLAPSAQKLILGPSYVPLRKEFAQCGSKTIPELAGKLLVMSGGSDPFNCLGGILSAVDLSAYEKIRVLCGNFSEKRSELEAKYGTRGNISIEGPTDHMREALEWADLCICAGGTTLYEVCAVGTPAVSYFFAENQRRNVGRFDKDGMIPCAGDARENGCFEQIAELAEALRADKGEREVRSLRMRQMIDGKGAQRIAAAITEDM